MSKAEPDCNCSSELCEDWRYSLAQSNTEAHTHTGNPKEGENRKTERVGKRSPGCLLLNTLKKREGAKSHRGKKSESGFLTAEAVGGGTKEY